MTRTAKQKKAQPERKPVSVADRIKQQRAAEARARETVLRQLDLRGASQRLGATMAKQGRRMKFLLEGAEQRNRWAGAKMASGLVEVPAAEISPKARPGKRLAEVLAIVAAVTA